jgi:succinate dehydrogenase / fumarate reductase cytochrome b subunit
MSVPVNPASSSVGSKSIVALTGLALVLFVLGHMAGNLLIFLGRDWLNSYAHHLKALGPFLWLIRAVLLAVFVLHIVLTLRLNYTNSAARPVKYAYEDTLQASWASRHMVLTGLVLLAFVVYHLAHFTLGVVHGAERQYEGTDRTLELPGGSRNYLDLTDRQKHGVWAPDPKVRLTSVIHTGEEYRQDVYSMVINGFRNPWISLSYLVAMAFLGLHLWHGATSMFQSLGVNGRAWRWLTDRIGPVIALVVVAGNCLIVVAVWAGLVR